MFIYFVVEFFIIVIIIDISFSPIFLMHYLGKSLTSV